LIYAYVARITQKLIDELLVKCCRMAVSWNKKKQSVVGRSCSVVSPKVMPLSYTK